MILLGTAAFFLMLLGDVNDALWHRSALRLCFPVGLILLAAATAARLSLEAFDTAWCAVAAAFLLVLLYALFGSFSVKDAYVSQECGRRVYDKGFYALCRHPGVLFLAGLYVSLHYALALPWADAAVYALLNLLLAALEDKWLFPLSIGGYDEYKTRVPFLIPTSEGIKKIFKR